jgi:ABC-2 type transport system ATP-binding protein
MSNPVVVIRDLSKQFGDIRALDGIDLTIDQGEMFCLVGPDGAGKTTLIRMLCGILPLTAGTITVLGYRLPEQKEALKPQIGYLSQAFSLYGDLTVDENIEFFAEIHGVGRYQARREELLAFTRLTPFRQRLAARLSGGMKQKLALACTLVHTPRLIFLDEPTTGVDPVSRRDFWKILADLLKDGITIVLATPYLDEAERSSRVSLMNQGRIMLTDRPRAIKQGMAGQVLEVVCGQVRQAAALVRSLFSGYEVQLYGDRLHIVMPPGSPDSGSVRERLAGAGIGISSVRTVSPSLENVFISELKRRRT